MRRLAILIILHIFVSYCCAQKYRYPVFDRTDEPRLHIDSVEFTKDSTFLYCSYDAAGSSWAQISNQSCLKDKVSGKFYRIAAVTGIPFHPAKRHFTYSTHVQIRLSCEPIRNLRSFDFIESSTDNSAFNIYGIDLSNQYVKQYSIDDERRFTNQADFYASVNDSLMLLYRNQELEARKYIHGNKSDAVTLSLYQLATSYNRLGNHTKAIEYGLQALDCQAKPFGKDNNETTVYPMLLGTIAGFYSDLGDLKSAISYYEQSAALYENLLGENDRNYAEIRFLMANTYMKADSIKLAIAILRDVVRLQKTNLGERHTSTLNSLNSLADFLGKDGKITEAIEIREYLSSILRSDASLKEMYALNIHNLAGDYCALNDGTKAIEYAKESVELCKIIYGEKTIEYRRSLLELAYIYRQGGDIDSAMKTLITSVVLYEQEDVVSDRDNYIDILRCLSECYALKNKFSEAVCYSKKAVDFVRNYLENVSKDMTSNERYVLWQQYHGIIDDDFPYYAAMSKDPNLIPYIYDLALYSKGFSLRDSHPICSWEDVQMHLSDGEVAIEFTSLSVPNNIEKQIFYALILDKHHLPVLIELFDLTKLDDGLSQMSNKDSILAELLWKPILPQITNIKRIYFSPTFIFNQIGIEYFPLADNVYISDQYELFRVSSTREITRGHTSFDYSNAVLYGDLDYDGDEALAKLDNENFNKGMRAAFDYLPQTKIEVSEISEILQSKNVQCTLLTGIKGTEDSFKLLSGKQIDIIHFATHGSYYDAESIKEKIKSLNMSFLSSGVSPGSMNRNEILTRSFLLMSGSNRLIRGDSIPEGKEDGFLTAVEISSLDLRGTELIVLSACKSSHGDWSADNGVLGLPRAFKEAGVNSILMSLRNVDDEATRILMVEFYKNLMSGKSKYQSLKDAQKHLRQVENGKYDDPKYWASFILLDGLN